jgi:hypothetical protein
MTYAGVGSSLTTRVRGHRSQLRERVVMMQRRLSRQ